MLPEAHIGTILLGLGLAALGFLTRQMLGGIEKKLDQVVEAVVDQGSRIAVVEVKVETGSRRIDGLEDREREITGAHVLRPHRSGG